MQKSTQFIIVDKYLIRKTKGFIHINKLQFEVKNTQDGVKSSNRCSKILTCGKADEKEDHAHGNLYAIKERKLEKEDSVRDRPEYACHEINLKRLIDFTDEDSVKLKEVSKSSHHFIKSREKKSNTSRKSRKSEQIDADRSSSNDSPSK